MLAQKGHRLCANPVPLKIRCSDRPSARRPSEQRLWASRGSRGGARAAPRPANSRSGRRYRREGASPRMETSLPGRAAAIEASAGAAQQPRGRTADDEATEPPGWAPSPPRGACRREGANRTTGRLSPGPAGGAGPGGTSQQPRDRRGAGGSRQRGDHWEPARRASRGGESHPRGRCRAGLPAPRARAANAVAGRALRPGRPRRRAVGSRKRGAGGEVAPGVHRDVAVARPAVVAASFPLRQIISILFFRPCNHH